MDLNKNPLKGNLFRVQLEIVHSSSTWEYESEDGRGSRSETTNHRSFRMYLSELTPSEKWRSSYEETLQKAKALEFELGCLLDRLRATERTSFELPSRITPEWNVQRLGYVSLTEEEYNTLSNVLPEERVSDIGFYSKEAHTGYLYLHYGIRGIYLEQFSVPGIEAHRKGGWESYCNMGDHVECEDSVKLLVGKALVFFGKAKEENWDMRHMPSFLEETKETLSDLFKDIKLSS